MAEYYVKELLCGKKTSEIAAATYQVYWHIKDRRHFFVSLLNDHIYNFSGAKFCRLVKFDNEAHFVELVKSLKKQFFGDTCLYIGASKEVEFRRGRWCKINSI